VIPPPDVETLEVQGTLALPDGAEIEVAAGEPDCTPGVLAVVMTVPAAQRHRLRVDQWLEITTDTVPGVGFLGRIKYISPAADPGTRWVRVVAHVSNEDGYLDVGLPVRGHIRMATQVTLSQP
jgi:multidrug efflux pump subunit AcrA (membrane-fusion protein)